MGDIGISSLLNKASKPPTQTYSWRIFGVVSDVECYAHVYALRARWPHMYVFAAPPSMLAVAAMTYAQSST